MPRLIDSVCVVLVRTQGPVNLGMVARLCGNLAISDLRLVAPLCEVNCPDSRKFATHARDFLLAAPVYATLDEAVADCGLVIGTSARERNEDFGGPLLPRDLPGFIAGRPAARIALVFGNEADGLDDGEMQRCQAFVTLETFGENYSYNLGHAAAILLYAVATSDSLAPSPEQPPGADRDQIEHLYAYWMHTLERFAYFRRTDAERFSPQLRRLLNRLHLSTHDVQMLWGMFAQFHYHSFGDRAGSERWRELARELGMDQEPPRDGGTAGGAAAP